ncbi:uncharacterized protein MYCFIDRAFT_177366 [Pseudocercospora fijiensis CIRAD86]|uniref:Uncharacterized protein n=1 Tax=Pseudocercospora fijiensis (strain CIRAD86) TaxID=383855 RepID=M3ASD8_PSEFD|nr:uncharacterized protein MYCFIDRAFT_177366 [Pseudocercospora fijiensis CIRAD86]EME80422.1 hypothetical protein MYCFIDRAFT_177366 [Pseudocercospora fijiensis CIRAD86]
METARMDPTWRSERLARKRSPVQNTTNNAYIADASVTTIAQESNVPPQERPPEHECTIFEHTTQPEDAHPPYLDVEQSRSDFSSASTLHPSTFEWQTEIVDYPIASSNDVQRLRHFIQYVLTIDYDVETTTSHLYPSDQQYFLQIGSQHHDLKSESTLEQLRLELAYKHLGLPFQTVLSMIKRFCGNVESSQGIYDQDILEFGKGEGDAMLATKLCLDKYVLIPRVVTDKKLRQALIRGNGLDAASGSRSCLTDEAQILSMKRDDIMQPDLHVPVNIQLPYKDMSLGCEAEMITAKQNNRPWLSTGITKSSLHTLILRKTKLADGTRDLTSPPTNGRNPTPSRQPDLWFGCAAQPSATRTTGFLLTLTLASVKHCRSTLSSNCDSPMPATSAIIANCYLSLTTATFVCKHALGNHTMLQTPKAAPGMLTSSPSRNNELPLLIEARFYAREMIQMNHLYTSKRPFTSQPSVFNKTDHSFPSSPQIAMRPHHKRSNFFQIMEKDSSGGFVSSAEKYALRFFDEESIFIHRSG